MYLSIGEVAKMIGVSQSSLRRWEHQKILTSDYKTPGGHRRYSYQNILQFLGIGKEEKPKKQVFIYARVSAIKQKEDLTRQIANLEMYAQEKGWEVLQVYSDIASGLNDERKSLLRLISDIPKIQPDYLLCSYRDRVARFGTGIIEQICQIYGTELVELQNKETTPEEDLVQTIIAMLYSFSGKLYRQRRGKREKIGVSGEEFL